MLQERGEKKIEIRSKMIDDLIVLINKLQMNNHELILTIDANEQFESGKGGAAKLISMTKFVDPIACTHGLQIISDTYQWGTKRIDFIFTSSKMYKYIRACGIIIFSQVFPSDHRDIFIDVELISLLQKFTKQYWSIKQIVTIKRHQTSNKIQKDSPGVRKKKRHH